MNNEYLMDQIEEEFSQMEEKFYSQHEDKLRKALKGKRSRGWNSLIQNNKDMSTFINSVSHEKGGAI